jgi:hypothetical protein
VAIILPLDLTVAEIRVLQEFRRIGVETLQRSDIEAVRHPVVPEKPAEGLLRKGYLTAADDTFTLTDKARAFLAIDAKPAVPGAPRG